MAQAFLAMARSVLDQPNAVAARRSRASLTAQVDPLSGWGRLRDGEILPPTSLAAALRSLPGRGGGRALRPLTAADLRRYDLGRTQRRPSARLRELLGTVDGERCRFPGCTRRHRLHAHHVIFWRDGGSTDLANLILVCPRHHTLVHAQGFRLTLDEDRTLRVHTADGVRALHHPALPWSPPDEFDPQCAITADTLPPDTVEARLDLGYAVMVLMQQAA